MYSEQDCPDVSVMCLTTSHREPITGWVTSQAFKYAVDTINEEMAARMAHPESTRIPGRGGDVEKDREQPTRCICSPGGSASRPACLGSLSSRRRDRTGVFIVESTGCEREARSNQRNVFESTESKVNRLSSIAKQASLRAKDSLHLPTHKGTSTLAAGFPSRGQQAARERSPNHARTSPKSPRDLLSARRASPPARGRIEIPHHRPKDTSRSGGRHHRNGEKGVLKHGTRPLNQNSS